jgi:hypothetical protein
MHSGNANAMRRILAKAAKCNETFDVLVQIGTNVNIRSLKSENWQ